MKIKTKDMILISMFTGLTCIGAYISIPIPFVPITLQSFFCILSGILLGSKRGMLSQVVYVFIGLAGAGVFAGGMGGPQTILHGSFGYLIGFIFAAYAAGKIRECSKIFDLKISLAASITGTLVIYLFGLPYLYLLTNFYTHIKMGIYMLLVYGFFQTIPGDILKCAIIAAIAVPIYNSIRIAHTI